ncbi:hypothetical protein OROGR_005257 [Orobanche gracilis]
MYTALEAISRNSKNSLWYHYGGGRNFDIHKKLSKKSVWHFCSKLDVPSNVVQKKRVVRILFFKIRPFQEILKISYGTALEAEEILIYIKNPQRNRKRVAHILFFKIRSSQEILKIRDGTPMEAEEILTYIKKPSKHIGGRNFDIHKKPSKKSVWHFCSKLDVPSNVVQKKRVVRILFFKIRPFQEILKIRYGTALEAEEILIYIKNPQRNRSSQEILKIRDESSQEILKIRDDVLSNVVQKKRVARIMFFKIRPSQEILKIRDGTPLEAEEILIYIKSPQNNSVWHFSSNLDVPTNVVQKKRVAPILFLKIRPSQEILKIRYVTPMETEEILTYIKKPSKQIVARILFFKIRPSQEILKIRDGTPLEAEEILIYIKSPQNKSVWHFSSNSDVPTNVVRNKRVAPILFLKIRPSQEILKIRYGTLMESEEILTYIKKSSKQIDAISRNSKNSLWYRYGGRRNFDIHKKPSKKSVWHFCSKLDVPSNVVQKKRVVRILFFKIRPSQEILKIRDDTPLEAEEILIYIKSPQNKSVWHFSSNSYVPTNVVQNKRVAPILFLKIRPSQEILKIRYGTLMESEEILTYIKKSVWHFYSNLDVPSNVVQKKRVARILFFKIRPFQEILKIRYGSALEAEEILIYIKSPQRNRSSQEIQKIHDGTPMEMPSHEILKICHGTPLETEEILTYIKNPQNRSVWHFYSNLDVSSIVVQKKRVAQILFFKIRPSQEILKIRYGTAMEAEEILIYIKALKEIEPSQEILKIRDGTHLEAEEILLYIKSPQNKSVWHFSSNLDVPTNVVQKKRVAPILFLKIRPSQEILKILYGTPMETEEILTYIKKPSKQIVARILFFKIRTSQEILKICHGTPLETEEILTYIKSPQNRSVWHFYSNLDVPSNVVQKKRVARILFFKIRPSQEILKICHGTPLETEEILTYIKSPQNRSVWHFYNNLNVPSIVVQKKRVARILISKLVHLKKF